MAREFGCGCNIRINFTRGRVILKHDALQWWDFGWLLYTRRNQLNEPYFLFYSYKQIAAVDIGISQDKGQAAILYIYKQQNEIYS